MKATFGGMQPSLPRLEDDDHDTPDDLYRELSERFGPFDLDAAASPHNAKCERYITKHEDALSVEWSGRVWCNPPYKDIIKWVRKAYEEVQSGRCETVCLLLPAHTSTAWFHDYALPFAEIYWVRRKRKFGGAKWVSPVASVAVVFKCPPPLKVGDRVAVIAKGPWQCRQGTVGEFTGPDDKYILVALDEDDPLWCMRHELAKLEEPKS